MEILDFWKIIAAARSYRGNDRANRVEALREQLGGLSPRELQSFQSHYDALIAQANRWDLRGAAYIMNGGCSDAGFRHFKDWLISEGESVYHAALADPESLAKLRRIHVAENAPYGCVARELFEATGAGEFAWNASADAGDPLGEPWEEHAVYDLFPSLSAKYD